MSRRLGVAAPRGAAEAFGVLPTQPRVHVPRQRLEAELDRATQHPLTVVVAPAGAGKTSGLARWAAATLPSARWLVAHKGDRPEVLARALLAAAGRADPHADWGAEDVPAAVVELLRSADPDPRPLVVDDAQHLAAGQLDPAGRGRDRGARPPAGGAGDPAGHPAARRWRSSSATPSPCCAPRS